MWVKGGDRTFLIGIVRALHVVTEFFCYLVSNCKNEKKLHGGSKTFQLFFWEANRIKTATEEEKTISCPTGRGSCTVEVKN